MNEMLSIVGQAEQPSAGREPAPGELGLVQAFMNTIDREGGEDEIADAPALTAWLGVNTLISAGTEVGESDLRRVHQVRDDLCALALANNGEAVDPASVERLNRAAAGALLALRFAPDGGSQLRPAEGGIDAAVARLLGIVYTAMAQGTWVRLKACRQDSCHWVFYDHSKNHSGAWCSMAVCGNRAKTRTYRRRRRGEGNA